MKKERLRQLLNTHSIKEISILENIPYSTVWYNVKKHRLTATRPLIHKYTLFDNFTSESCYWAGFIAADGNVLIRKKNGTYRLSIKLASKDLQHLEKFDQVMGCESRVSTTKYKMAHISFHSKKLIENIVKNFNIVPKKSLILQPPVKMPQEFNKDYIRGYFDGDGHIGYVSGTYCNFNIVSGSLRILEWIRSALIEENLVNEKLKIYQKKHNLYCIDINSQVSLNIFKWLYTDSKCNLRLDRKHKMYQEITQKIESKIQYYEQQNKRVPSGCKGFNLNYKKISEEYLTGKQLKELSKKYKVSQWTLLDNFKKLGIKKNKKRSQDSEVFKIFTSESCYWAGFIAADGWVNKYNLGIELSIKDINHLKKFRSFINSNCDISTRKKFSFGKIFKYCNLYIYSKKMIDVLKENFNIVSNKSLVYVMPEKISKDMQKHFIRGYIDGDGSIGWHKHNNKPRVHVCSGSKKLLEQIKKIIKEQNKRAGNPSILKTKSGNLYTLSFMGHQAYDILNWLYKDSTIYLDRKYEKYIEVISRYDLS